MNLSIISCTKKVHIDSVCIANRHAVHVYLEEVVVDTGTMYIYTFITYKINCRYVPIRAFLIQLG